MITQLPPYYRQFHHGSDPHIFPTRSIRSHYIAPFLLCYRVLYLYIDNVEVVDLHLEVPKLAILKVYIKNTSMIRRIGGLHKLRDLTIIGLDNTTRPLLTNFDLHSMPNLKKIQLLNLLVANFPWDSNLLIDIDYEIDRPVD